MDRLLIREGRAHDRVSALAAMRADEARALGEAYLARVARLRQTDRPLFVDKAPGNLLNLPLIRLALPARASSTSARSDGLRFFALYPGFRRRAGLQL
jgi:hypothetical protein